jgi:DNA-binding NarL/FixJ family response regulator
MNGITQSRPSIGRAIQVLLAEDHLVVREGLKALLESEGDIRVIGEADNGRSAVELARQLRPSVILMDISMPLLNGLEASRQILKILPSTRILILSAHHEENYVHQAMELGAAGYLIKQTTLATLSKMIRDVHAGAGFQGLLAGSSRGGTPLVTSSEILRSREREVLQLVAEGYTNKRIAEMLYLSIKTVEKHRQQLMEKLDIHDTAGLTRYAISAGIIQSGIPLSKA